jgi:hypothetical protein
MAVGSGANSPRKPMKTLEPVKDKKFPMMLRLQFKEGGKLPSSLSGLYGGFAEAQKAIDDWNEGITRDKIYPSAPKNDKPSVLKPKVKTDGEAKDPS